MSDSEVADFSAPQLVRLTGAADDEAVSIGSRVYYPHRLRPLTRGKVRLALHAATVGPVTVGTLQYSSPIRVETDALADGYQVNIPMEWNVRTRIGDSRMVATPQRAAVYRPDKSSSFEGWEHPCRMLAIKIERGALERHLSTLSGSAVTEPIDFLPAMDLTSPWAREWLACVQLFARQFRAPDSLARHPLMTASISESVMTGLLLCATHDRKSMLVGDVPDVPSAAIRHAIDLIEHSPERFAGVSEIAAAVGVSSRTLQLCFRQHLDVTPLEYLKKTRMLRAHRDLVTGQSGDTVAEIAMRWGFSHLGRFAREYMERFGERPSDTLKHRLTR